MRKEADYRAPSPSAGVAASLSTQVRLTSWKAIAAYLQCNERTAKRWEQDRALPVHRLPGGRRGGVFGYSSELDAWLSTEKSRPEELSDGILPGERKGEHTVTRLQGTPRARLVWGAAAAACLLAILATVFIVERRTPIQRHHVPAPGAEDLYFQGRYLWNLRTADSLGQAIDAFTQAIVKDPSYAEAYAGLAESYDLLPQFGQADMGESLTRAIGAAERAIQLDPDLAAAHRARAFALFFWNWDIPGSDAEFQRSLALDPNAAQTHQWYASTLHQRLEGAECMRQANEALRLNPTSPAIAADAALFRAEFGDLDAGLRALREIEHTQPALSSPAWFQRQLDFARGDYPAYVDDARRYALITRSPDDLALADALALGWRNGGKTGLLESRAKVLKQSFDRGAEPGFMLGQTLLLLGHPKEGLPFFRAAFEKHYTALITMEMCPWAKPLARDSGYAALFAQIRARLHGGRPAPQPMIGVSFRLPQ